MMFAPLDSLSLTRSHTLYSHRLPLMPTGSNAQVSSRFSGINRTVNIDIRTRQTIRSIIIDHRFICSCVFIFVPLTQSQSVTQSRSWQQLISRWTCDDHQISSIGQEVKGNDYIVILHQSSNECLSLVSVDNPPPHDH